MYLYFNKEGVLKEIVNDKPLRQGSVNVDFIYAYFETEDGSIPTPEELEPKTLWISYLLPDGTTRVPSWTAAAEIEYPTEGEIAYEEVPHNHKRDLKFFKYYQKYPFYVIPLEFVNGTTVESALSQNGVVCCTIRINEENESLNTYGMIVFNVEKAVLGVSDGNIGPDLFTTVAQFQYLLSIIGSRWSNDQIISYLSMYYYTETEIDNLLNGKLDKDSPYYMKVVSVGEGSNINQTINSQPYNQYLQVGDIFYEKTNKQFYKVSSGEFGTFVASAIELSLSELLVSSLEAGSIILREKLYLEDFDDIESDIYGGLESFIDSQVSPKADKTYVDRQDNALRIGINDSGHSLYLVESTDPSKEYDYIIQLKDKANNVISSVELDLPLESIITQGTYDNTTQEIVLTLDNGSEVRIPVGDLISGLVDEQGLAQALQPYVKELEVSSVLTTNDLLEQVGTNKYFVLDNMGDPLLCYISEDGGTYTILFFGKNKAYHSTFSENTLVINLLSNSTLDIDYLPIIELSASMQTLTASELEIAKQDNSVIKYNGRVYVKANETTTAYEYVSADYDIADVGENNQITKYEISVNKTTGATSMIQQLLNVYSVGEIDTKLEEYAKVDGNYPTMTVGNADDLTPYGENSGAEDDTPFVFQSTGGSKDVGTRAYLKSLRGNSVAFNQLNTNTGITETKNDVTFTKNNDGSWSLSGTATANITKAVMGSGTLLIGHKYLLCGCPYGGNTSTYSLIDSLSGALGSDIGNGNIVSVSGANKTFQIAIVIKNGVNTNGLVFRPQLFDLTLMFGAGNEPTSVLEFNRLFPKLYYEYNAGTLLSCKVNGIKNVGYNAFDGELIHGNIDNNGVEQSSNYYARSKNTIKVIAGQTYSGLIIASGIRLDIFEYDEDMNFIIRHGQIQNESNKTFTLNSNCHYLKLRILALENPSTTVVSLTQQIAIHLTWDGSRTGYEEHKEWQYALPNIELRSAGNVYDELKPDGTLIRRIGVVDLGTLTPAQDIGNDNVWFYSIDNLKTYGVSSIENTIKCSKYVSYSNVDRNNYEVGCNMGYSTYQSISFRDPSMAGKTKAQIKETMSGVYLFYELVEPTTEQISGFQEPQQVDDFGTQEFLYDSDIDIPVPQGNDFFYPVDYKAFIDSLGGREDIEYDATKIVSQTQLANYLKTISGYDATKTQTLKNVNGTFTWVDDE